MNPLLNADAVATLLGISRAAAYREMKKMQHVVIGDRTLRVTEAAVETYVRPRATAAKHPTAGDLGLLPDASLRRPRASS